MRVCVLKIVRGSTEEDSSRRAKRTQAKRGRTPDRVPEMLGAGGINSVWRYEALLGSAPGREGAAGEEGFGGPFAEVDRERDAVTVVAGEDHYFFAAGMPLGGKPAEDGAHSFREEDRAAPAVGDAHISKGGV